MSNKSVAIKTDPDTNSDYCLQLNRWFLKPIGAWPSFPSRTRHERIISFLLNVSCYSSLLFTLIPCLLHMLLEDESFYLKMKVLGSLAHWFVGTMNYTTLLLRGREIRLCVEHIKTDWRIVTREEDQQVMLKNAKFGRYVAALSAAILQSGVLCFCCMTISRTELIQIGNETRIVHVLPCAVYKKLIDVTRSPNSEFIIASQFLSGFIVNSSTAGIFSLAAILGAHACGQLSVVMTWITEFVNKSKKREKMIFREIGLIVEHHLRTLK